MKGRQSPHIFILVDETRILRVAFHQLKMSATVMIGLSLTHACLVQLDIVQRSHAILPRQLRKGRPRQEEGAYLTRNLLAPAAQRIYHEPDSALRGQVLIPAIDFRLLAPPYSRRTSTSLHLSHKALIMTQTMK
jgi:hypothetical protein